MCKSYIIESGFPYCVLHDVVCNCTGNEDNCDVNEVIVETQKEYEESEEINGR